MKTHILSSLSERSFLYLWLGEIFTQISINLFNFLAILVVFERTHSNTAVSGMVIAFTIPALLFGSIAGAYVDRWDKKKVLIVSNILRAVLLIFLAFSLKTLFLIYSVGFVIAVITQFFIPAETPMIPLVVNNKYLYSANALFGMGIYGSILIAYVLSGPLIIYLKPANTLLILASMLLIGAGFIGFITLMQTKNKTAKKNAKPLNILRDIRQTLSFISHTKVIYRSLFLLALSQILILLVATIAPGFAHQILGIRVEQFPLLFMAPAALGMVVGAVILVNRFHNHPKENVITFGLFLSGISMLFLPYGSRVASRGFVHTINIILPRFLRIDILHIIMLLAFILGVANSLVFVPANTILQEQTADEVRGKIYGFMNTFVGALSLIPILLVGGLSDLLGVGAVISGIGILLLVLGGIRLFLE